ncbi:NAD(P)-dependent dehydrogenase, short-chain alcohol dehydrogenase family [Halopseudomonas formosensis]|uniref:NAD(P)-dependent dehydrogenase, short-chain alcohol dehydrogenase family n=1 Tax=Halopseudomonas formosensis TaxID=1002526 RepID=A0A1I6B1Z4_9GAMM|nr:YciK family oxidoreductase [Halopseudomonas formosensis]NLC01944.1 YciK family oxidoreductase [Halopseudomonas formosensis]SFQ74982.1 NAD(P)-dependent dehydrogenase, short-chain alcohol dehydrogenase family [Halopseudomonas formosensis]
MFDYQASPDLLQGRVILVTGAGDGIGRACALACAAHGATVVLLGRTLAKLEAVYDEIEKAGYPQPAICPLNLETAAEKDYNDLADQLFDTFGKLDGLVHNAAQLGPRTLLDQVKNEDWLRLMQVNVNAPFALTKAMMPLLRAAPDASVIFVSSSVGRRARAYWGPYAVSKFALEGLMQVLADEQEGTSEIRVNSINPGATRTAMRKAAYPAEEPEKNPEPADIMPAFLYLLGPDSQKVNGQALDARG